LAGDRLADDTMIQGLGASSLAGDVVCGFFDVVFVVACCPRRAAVSKGS
jgi:hypothetical protein